MLIASAVAFSPGAIVWHALPPPADRPASQRTGENHFYEIFAVRRVLVPLRAAPWWEIWRLPVAAISTQELEPFVAANERTFRDFHEWVWRPSGMPLEDSEILPAEDALGALRCYLRVYVEGLLRQQRNAEAAEAMLDQIRFGTACSYSPFVAFENYARWIEREGLCNAAQRLSVIPLSAIPDWLEKLRALEPDRPDAPTVRQLNRQAVRWYYVWPWRLQETAFALTGNGANIALDLIDPESFVPRNLALLRLLRCELAIRAFQARHDRAPDSLAELIPAWLLEEPDDPYGQGKLIYRRGEAGYLLYSVGPNGLDDGGQRVETPELHERGDVFVDSYVETPESSETSD